MFLYVTLGIGALLFLIVKIYFIKQGNAKLIVEAETRTTFEVEEMDNEKVVLVSKINFKNEGTQCATITDCCVRTLLPFEQYDGVDVRGKAERTDEPREDDYFEAYIIAPQKNMMANLKITLVARKGMNIQEALSHMVDLPMDIIYTELSRTPWTVKKVRLVLSAEEISKATGIVLVEE